MSPPPNEERRPRQEAAPTTSTTKSSPIVSRVGTYPLSVDLAACSRRDFELYLAGYETAYAHGIDRGREQADEEAQRLHDNAVRVVRAMARLDPWDVAQQRRRGAETAAAERHAAQAMAWASEVTR